MNRVFGQINSQTDSLAIENTISLYNQSPQARSKLYNGVEDVGYDRKIMGNPYFLTSELTTGGVDYDGKHYDNIPLLYDMVQDELVIQYYSGPIRILLQKEKTQSFNLLNHHFIHITPTDSLASQLKPGYYDQLYSGRLKLLARRTSSIIQVINPGNKIGQKFTSKNEYFIIKNGRSYPVSGISSALKITDRNEGQVKAYLKKKNLKYKSQPESVLVLIVSYQDNNPD
ncbi:hypothetical protein [Arcticibacter tournemirensis]|uniref:Uncharacterized protein n=1 Tax=Arcticibacter tournemirensis TaxID=699437 RepID=A0A4Q0MG25_9SPHI|nr:hypothetical protein [Arcticibacter tournemirensis]RXF71929.1 hypothetical protein EKH83_04390 [Arcticibacter tournemirensis]